MTNYNASFPEAQQEISDLIEDVRYSISAFRTLASALERIGLEAAADEIKAHCEVLVGRTYYASLKLKQGAR